ncbi:hypothetical protein OWM54_42460 [Myxococcus sp. MISCRS1]|uniref:hypothetical protein n=1 Tax=Myxococcus sp. MISCRS1 TaxID=2996786 RepID=UPI00226D73B6|nr:hypothetical protein [Myxococcus sp. MISCRS1]MCY1003830.1 hypothetical protein [Myxococcus sp. MISCRS1]
MIETSLWGIETFDRMECGDLIQELLERRLRRYLIWALQLARARTLRTNAQVWEMLGERLFVELAPLRKRFDNQQDTLIAEAPPEAELFVVYRSRLMRLHRRPGFEPASLVEVVRRFDRTVLFSMMDFVAEQEHSILTPWVE